MNALYITIDTYYSELDFALLVTIMLGIHKSNVPPEKIDIGFSYYSVLRTGTMKEELIAPCAGIALSEAATLL